jgi:outer membrane lipoprotein LolB
MSDLKPFALAGLFLLLGACATYAPVDDAARLRLWHMRQTALHDLMVWQVDGRTAISSEQGSGKLALHWSQDREHFDIRLMTFLGQQQARLLGINGGRTRLLRPSQPPLEADNEDALMQEALGWSLPLAGLRYWLLGLPQPGADMRKALDGQGRPIWLEQDGWHIEYAAYQNVGDLSLPRKLRLSHADLSARLVLDQWSFDDHGD